MKPIETIDPLAEARELIEALLEDRISPEQAALLEQLVVDRQDVRRLYLRYMLLHCTLPPYGASEAPGDGSSDDTGSGIWRAPGQSVAPTAVAPTPAPSAGSGPARAAQTVETMRDRRWVIGWTILPWLGAALAACVAIVLIVHHRTPAPTPQIASPVTAPQAYARLTASAAAQWEDSDDLALGSAVEPGKILKLEGGAAEVTFASGARMVVEAPASFYVENGNAARLDYGKVAAVVPEKAHGFIVTSDQLVVRDLGTEFGMSVSPEDGAATVDVFVGKVDVSHKASDDSARKEPSHLTQGQAVNCSTAGGPIQASTHNQQPFLRTITARSRVPIYLHNTGKSKNTGLPDPWWQIVAESADPKFKPQPAIELHAWTAEYLANNYGNASRWITTSPQFPVVPAGTYTFRTSLDFNGFDPFTVSVKARVLVDDAVDDILVNGRSTGVKLPALPASDKLRFKNFRTIELKGPFAAGRNQVDFVVRNLGGHMMLRVQWDARGVPLVKQARSATTQK